MKKLKFSENVLRWAHVWSPREDCTPEEIRIINKIFNRKTLIWNEEKQFFILPHLDISNNTLTRLTFLPPLIIKRQFQCIWTNIKSLEGGPIEAKEYYCYLNNLKDLRGAPLKCEDFNCSSNPLKDFRVYTEPYAKYYAPMGARLIFIDPSKWTLEEYESQKKNIDTSDLYL